MSDICKIDFSSLKNSESIFKDELNNFNYKTYTTFSSCYLRKIPNDYLEKMSDELQKLYDQIKDGYNNIDKWWNDYIENFESLEDYLADINYVDCISEPLIRDNAKQLPELKDFNLDSPEIVIVNADDSESKFEFKDNEVNSSTTDYYSTSSESDISDVNAGKVVEEYKMDDKVSEVVSEETVVSDEWETKDLSEIELSDGVGAIIAAGVSVLGDVLKWWDDTTEGVSNWFDDVGAFVSGGVKSLWSSVTDWWSDTTQFVDGWFDDVSVFVSDGVESLLSSVTDWWSDVTDWWSSDALPWIQTAADAVWDVVKSTGATVAVLVQSLVEGVLQFGEGIVDLAVLLGTGVCSLFTGAADIVQAVNAFFTDEEWSSYTIAMWEGTKGFVSKEYVTGWFDSLYQDTVYGQWLAENSFFFDTTRSIASGVGYISGAVLLSIATFGVGSVVTSGGTLSFSAATAATSSAEMAVTATAAGIGRGTQNAWNNGADLVEGLVAGTFNGLWEGLQFYIGGKINGLKVFGTDGILKTIQFSDIKTQLLNSLSHVILDGIDAGVEGFVIPFIDSLYKDGYYDENGNYIEFTENQSMLERYSELFDDNGGWSTVLTQASIGSVASLIGEAFSLRKYFKDSKSPLDRLLGDNNSLKNNREIFIDSNDKLRALTDFKNAMAYGDVSDTELVSLMSDTFSEAIDNGNLEAFEVLTTITELKKSNPALKLVVLNDSTDCYWSRSQSAICIGYVHLEMADSGTLFHELGHSLFDDVLNGELPNNWDIISADARGTSSNNGSLKDAGDLLAEIERKTRKQAKSELEDNLAQMGKTLKQYEKELALGYESELLKEYSSSFGDNIADKIELKLKVMLDANKMAIVDINDQIKAITERINRTEYGDWCAISDMIDALYKGRQIDSNGKKIRVTYQHGARYYEEGAVNSAFHEIIANFNQLKITGSKQSLVVVKNIFGDEFYDLLEDVFSQFYKYRY